MKRLITAVAAACTLALAGCATTIRSDVTTFHQWPANLTSKTYSIDAPDPADDTLEVRSYLDLVRGQLARLGFTEAGADAALKVKMRFRTTDVPVRVVQAVDPFWGPSSRFGYWGSPYRRSAFRGFYDPFWVGPAGYEVVERHVYQRDVQVGQHGGGQRSAVRVAGIGRGAVAGHDLHRPGDRRAGQQHQQAQDADPVRVRRRVTGGGGGGIDGSVGHGHPQLRWGARNSAL